MVGCVYKSEMNSRHQLTQFMRVDYSLLYLRETRQLAKSRCQHVGADADSLSITGVVWHFHNNDVLVHERRVRDIRGVVCLAKPILCGMCVGLRCSVDKIAMVIGTAHHLFSVFDFYFKITLHTHPHTHARTHTRTPAILFITSRYICICTWCECHNRVGVWCESIWCAACVGGNMASPTFVAC